MAKIWFVTGATRGIGRQIALSALEAGHSVVATGRDPAKVKKAVSATDAGERLLVLPLDVTQERQITCAVDQAIDRFGRIDVLVNNAGYGLLGPFETVSPAAIVDQYATNVFGAFNVTRAVLPSMRRQRAGHILNLSSIGGVVGFGGCAAYTSSKFAIEGFSEDLAIDVKPFGIRVTLIEPGFFRTDFLDKSSIHYGDVDLEDYAAEAARQHDEYSAHHGQQAGDPHKLGEALLAIVAADDPPLRYAAGSDAVRMTRETLEKRLAELARWETLSRSTDFSKNLAQ